MDKKELDIKKELDALKDMCFPKDPNKETVREEDHPEKEWFKEAGDMKLDKLQEFMDRMLNHYNHDYGTIVHAVSACAIAAAWAACDVAGLTGFQAGFVMWDFIREWNHRKNECGMKLVDYDNLLYPQYRERMDKVISKDTWELLQKKAKELLQTEPDAHFRVQMHWQSIVDGDVPFGYKVVDRL